MRALAPEPIFQLYRGGVPGANAAEKREKLRVVVAQSKKIGLTNVCFHGFPRETRDAWDGLAELARSEGVGAVVAYGLDGEADGGKPFTGAAKGALIGEVLSKPSCVGGLIDAEGRWDDADEGKPGDVTDKDDALALMAAIRTKAPTALLGDQPWFAIDSHGELRAKPLANDPKDVFRGFPVDEFARLMTWRRFRQAYCNEAGFKSQWGAQRYEKINAWMARDWEKLRAPFAAAGLPFDLGTTIQGYGWDDIPSDLVHCILNNCVTLQQELIIWCDYAPSAMVLAGVRVFVFLRTHGFAVPGFAPAEIVRNYQTAYNATSPSRPLTVDGACGPATMRTMGILP